MRMAAVTVAILSGYLMLAAAAAAQDQGAQSLSVRAGFGAGYTIAPASAGESPGGDWNAEAFVLMALHGVPVELRPTVFSYGRGTQPGPILTAPCALGGCATQYFSGTERVVGGTLDALFPIARGPLVPYLLGGLGPVWVSRQNAPPSTIRSAGLGYDFGSGVGVRIASVELFGEAKFFGTQATADRFGGHGVSMLPLTFGIAF